jgi:cysteine-rich repeat protein
MREGQGCGDGILQANEECDDGNGYNTDGCTNDCKKAFCGDGFTYDGVEQCDDGNTNDLDGYFKEIFMKM